MDNLNLSGGSYKRYAVDGQPERYLSSISIFLSALGLIALMVILLEDSEALSRPHIDFLGASFFFGAILFLMLGLNFIAENFSVSSILLTVIFLAVSFSFLCLFFRHEKKDSNPILDMALLRSKPFLAANLFNMVLGAGFFGIYSFIPLYATSAHQLSTLVSGMVVTPRFIGAIPASGRRSKRETGGGGKL